MKNITWILLFLLLAFAGDRIAGWVLGKITMESQFRYSSLYRGDAGCEILLVGNSRGLIFYQPYIEEQTGKPTCNLSYNGMPIDLAGALIKDHLDRYGTAKKVLIDISMLDKRMNERLIAGFNFYTPYSQRLSKLLKEYSPQSYYGGFVTHLYRFNSEVFQRALYYWKKSDKDWLLDRIISPSLQAQVEAQDSFYYDYTPEMIRELVDVVTYARQKGVSVELVVNPYYPPFAEKIGNLNEMMAEIRESTGLEVHNYANSIQEVEGFGDYQHLNKTGAKAFLDQLMKDRVLP